MHVDCASAAVNVELEPIDAPSPPSLDSDIAKQFPLPLSTRIQVSFVPLICLLHCSKPFLFASTSFEFPVEYPIARLFDANNEINLFAEAAVGSGGLDELSELSFTGEFPESKGVGVGSTDTAGEAGAFAFSLLG